MSIADDPRVHHIARGCTHPATKFGVPVNAFVLTAITCALPGFWLINVSVWYALAVWSIFPVVFVAMRIASRKDPHTLLLLVKRFSSRQPHRNKRLWGAVTFSPFRYDKK